MSRLPFLTPKQFSLSEIDSIARDLASFLAGGLTVGLNGDLAAGKTTLVRALVKALGGNGDQVASPTYALCHEYQLPSGLLVEHWDLYRLARTAAIPEELYHEAWSQTLRLVEWPMAELLVDIHIRLSVVDPLKREIWLEGA